MEKDDALVILAFLFAVWYGFGQLNPGDIAFVQYNSDGQDNFAFVALTNISDTEIIFFTDNEENDLNGVEGTITWTPPSGGVTCGTVILITTSPSTSLGSVTVIKNFNFAVGGDSILAYQGSESAPTFIAALSNDGGSWGGDQDGNLPPGLVNGATAIAISPEVANCAYNGAITNNTQSVLLSEINNNSNWTLISNDTQQNYSSGPFGVIECGAAPAPELQLVDNTSTIQNCGYTVDFGDVASDGSTSDITFDIENIGTADLSVSSLNITGNYTVIGPAAPITITAGQFQTVTVRFEPDSDGDQVGELTIINNDSNEDVCPINLTGEGFTPGPNIVVRGVIGSNPTIANGSTTTTGINNTRFAQRTIGVDSQEKFFRIGNEGGTLGLNVASITLSGDTADFFVTENIANAISPDTFQDFSITFRPTTDSGIRTAMVSIANSDADKNPYTFRVQGRANCAAVSGSIFPQSGPPGTTIVVNSPGNALIGATASLNGVPLDFVSNATDELVVSLPSSIEVGGPLSVELSNGCIFSNNFSLINEAISGCDTNSGGTVDDLFISEVTDSPSGSLSYVELYNATGSAINFADNNYQLTLFNNGNTSTSFAVNLNTGIIAQNDTYVISFGANQPFTCSVIAGGDGSFADLAYSSTGASINFQRNSNNNLGHDCFKLSSPDAVSSDNPEGIVDVWGVFGDETWASGVGLGGSGARFERNTAAVLPNTTYSNADWLITNLNDCPDVDYSDIGTFDFSTGVPPTITNQSDDPIFTCILTETISVVAIEGFDESGDTKNLEYRWFANAPGSNSWDEIIPLGTNNYENETTPFLTILDTSLLNGYQYYCQVRENDTSCFKASDAIKLSILRSLWDGNSWSELPDFNRIVILNNDYDTSKGSFEACKLIVGSGANLIIGNGDYIEVENDLTVDGSIVVKPTGSFVQVSNSAIVDGAVVTDRNKIAVEKRTASLTIAREYTYWSSPVSGETIGGGLAEASSTRRYFFRAQNYLDAFAETNNNNASVPGQDNVDDDGNDWQQILDDSFIMETGVGYAATHTNLGIFPNSGLLYTFNGPFNNGIIEVPIYRNDSELEDTNWNFIGNPYPSAISASEFLNANTNLDPNIPDADRSINGAIYLWSHHTAVSSNANGNEPLNYSSSDYAIINGVDGIAGGDGIVPNGFIPSGQGFFVAMSNSSPASSPPNIVSAKVTFNNSMRKRTIGSNSTFFRNSNSLINKIRLNLSSDLGVFSQIVIAFIHGATKGDDGMFFDAPKNAAFNTGSILYSLMEDSNKLYGIQAKAISDLSINEEIKLGFKNFIEAASIYTISIAEIEGDFMSSNTIYIKDNLLNITHDLTQSNYLFTSETGTFNERFEIVFTASSLSNDENQIFEQNLSILELKNGQVKFSVNNGLKMKRIEIISTLGQKLYTFTVNGFSEIINLTNLSQSVYLAKVTYSNGITTLMKQVKR